MSALVSRRTFFRKVLELLAARPGYVWGGKSLPGLDCSGFVTHAFHLAGGADMSGYNTDRLWLELPRVQSVDILPGDVALYFGASKGPDDVSHAMVCLGFGLVGGMAWGGSSDVDAATSRNAGKVALVRELAYRDDLAGFVRLSLA